MRRLIHNAHHQPHTMERYVTAKADQCTLHLSAYYDWVCLEGQKEAELGVRASREGKQLCASQQAGMHLGLYDGSIKHITDIRVSIPVTLARFKPALSFLNPSWLTSNRTWQTTL